MVRRHVAQAAADDQSNNSLDLPSSWGLPSVEVPHLEAGHHAPAQEEYCHAGERYTWDISMAVEPNRAPMTWIAAALTLIPWAFLFLPGTACLPRSDAPPMANVLAS